MATRDGVRPWDPRTSRDERAHDTLPGSQRRGSNRPDPECPVMRIDRRGVIHPESAEFFGACGGHSFISQGHYGIDAHRTSSGEIAREQSHRAQECRHADKRDWIGRDNTVKQG